MPAFAVVEADLDDAAVQALLRLHAEGMLAASPPGSCHFLDLDGLRATDVTVWSVWDGDELAGIGALKEIEAHHGEVKSMRTAPAQLGRGVGAHLLRHIVGEARRRGYGRLSLETGSGPPFAAALALYERFGFAPCEPFAGYRPDPFSRFFTLAL